MDMFMKIVNKTVPPTFKTFFKHLKFRSELKKFKKTINEGSPSFGVLWSFADFIKYAEIIFFFNNTKKNYLYSSDGYEPGHNGFRISFEEYIITVKLYTESQIVAIEIEYPYTNHRPVSYKFKNGNWVDEPDNYDILLIDRVINIINMNMIKLVDWCVAKRLLDQIKV